MVSVPTELGDFWEAYGDSSKLIMVEDDGPSGSLAANVLDTFDIDLSSSDEGGNLSGLDIKNMDALAVINLSLLEASAESSTSYIYEIIADTSGGVKFITIGSNSASLSDIYYQVQSSTYKEKCVGVLVRGGKPLPEWVSTEWDTIWANGGYRVFDTTEFLSNCSSRGLSTHATIIFNNPNLEGSTYNDGINNLYDIEDPYEKIIGYATYKHVPGFTDSTKINYSNTADVPVVVSTGSDDEGADMGTLVDKATINPESAAYGEECWTIDDQNISITNGVQIPLSEELRFTDVRGTIVDKFKEITDIYIIGTPLDKVKSAPYGNDSAAANETPNDDNHIAIITVASNTRHVFKLEKGKDYVIVYGEDGDFKIPYVVFGKDASMNEPKLYGKDTKYIIGHGGLSSVYAEGTEGVGSIFPVAGNKGYLVDQVIAIVNIETPSINIYDPEFNGVGDDGASSKAIDIASNFLYLIKPLVLYEPPASIAFNGNIIDQTDGVVDNDPTTQQDFTDTALELVMDELSSGGGGMELTLPFLNDLDDDSKLANISSALFDYMNNGTGIETNYICGPNTTVELGQRGPSGGIINNVTYSYTDSGSYTISVNEGPRLVKPLASGGPSGATIKASESVSARGTVIQNLGNGIHFKVRIDGFGERVAINTCHSVLREGDVVSCSIHNNPAEV